MLVSTPAKRRPVGDPAFAWLGRGGALKGVGRVYITAADILNDRVPPYVEAGEWMNGLGRWYNTQQKLADWL